VSPESRGADGRRPPFFYALVAVTGLLLAMVACSVVSAIKYGKLMRQDPALPTTLGAGVAANSAAAEFTLPTADGSTMALKDLRGKVVLLNFWATWCPPCKAEMPDLDAVYSEFGAARDFVIVGIDMEEPRETVQAFAESNRITFPLALDTDGKVSTQGYGVRTLPTSILIDREGRIVDSWNGQISRAALLKRLEPVW